MSLYRSVLRPLLFMKDAETAHEQTMELLQSACQITGRIPVTPFTYPSLRTEVAGICFPNPVGLAAGCDKNGVAINIWPRLGFGFVEIGTVTAEPQPGNPRPRVFRLLEEEAIINRLGFNSEGAEKVARRLSSIRRGRPLSMPLGVNIGKTKRAVGDEAVLNDYRSSFRRLVRYADFMVVNVSSPNTPGLRQWQDSAKLMALLSMLQEEAQAVANLRRIKPVPLFVKVSPDMAPDDLETASHVALSLKLAGIIASNTTISRDMVPKYANEAGGLSGTPIRALALQTLRQIYKYTNGKLPIIGVGGISTAEDAYNRIKAGASLIQIYTGLVFKGPYLPLAINKGLIKLMERDGVKKISDIVGVDN